MLQKDLLSSRMNPDLTQMIIGHQIRGDRLYMGADQHVGRQIHQIVLKRSPGNGPAKLCDFFKIRTVFVDYIAGIYLRLLFP